MIGRAWVFRCDSCGKVEMVYADSRGTAVQIAIDEGWTVDGKMCYCQGCQPVRVAKAEQHLATVESQITFDPNETLPTFGRPKDSSAIGATPTVQL